MNEAQHTTVRDVCIKSLSDEQTEVARISMSILAGNIYFIKFRKKNKSN